MGATELGSKKYSDGKFVQFKGKPIGKFYLDYERSW
jgi:hypothetical protein